jgi:transcriptional regulator with XRE-family HTH domain
MAPDRTYSPVAVQAAGLLGARIRLARRERRWTLGDLAERVGVSHVTMARIERGDMTVRLGFALEAAALLGVALFHEDSARRTLEAERVGDRLALLPQLVRRSREPDDAF